MSTSTLAHGRTVSDEATSASTAARLLAGLGILGAVACAVVIMSMDLNATTLGIDPIRRTVSEYGLHDQAWLFNGAVLALAIGSLAVLVALVLRRMVAAASFASVLTVLWSAGLIGVTIFPKHDWSVGPSVSGNVHRVMSLVAFIALPLAVFLIHRRLGRRGRRPTAAWVALAFAIIAVGWFAAIGVAIVNMATGGEPWWQSIPLGLVERGLAGSELLAVVALGVLAFTGGQKRPAVTS